LVTLDAYHISGSSIYHKERPMIFNSLKFWITLAIASSIGFIFFVIFRQSSLTKLSFEKQRLEKELTLVHKKKYEKEQILLALYDAEKIQEIAATKLGMQKISLSQIRSLSSR